MLFDGLSNRAFTTYAARWRIRWGQQTQAAPENALRGAYFDPDIYARSVPKLFDHLRNTIGHDIELLHDVHERLAPIEAVRLAKQLEPYRLFFLEDLLPPEQIEWFRMIRQQCTTPIAMGELFTNRRVDAAGIRPVDRLHPSACERDRWNHAGEEAGDTLPGVSVYVPHGTARGT